MSRTRASAPVPDAAAIAGLLAEPERLRAFAAVVLGAETAAEVAAQARLEMRVAVHALERLVAGGLVEAGDGGKGLRPVESHFKDAARRAGAQRRAERDDEFADLPAEQAAVLRAFVVDGRIERIPAPKGKRRVVLNWLATRFEPGRTYAERDVNLILGMVNADVAALRRYLVDEEFLERRDGFYWRAGGTFDV